MCLALTNSSTVSTKGGGGWDPERAKYRFLCRWRAVDLHSAQRCKVSNDGHCLGFHTI
jgi:hypothetical protein